MGFGEKWIVWIKECLMGSRASILVNGCPTKEFLCTNGVKQGCPLSPFLFILAMEPLTALVKKMEDLGLLKGFSFPKDGHVVSHLNFSYDTIFFLDKDPLFVSNLVRMLRCFAIISRLQVNFHKSLIIGVGIDHSLVLFTAVNIFSLYSTLPFIYLGFPLSASPRRIST